MDISTLNCLQSHKPENTYTSITYSINKINDNVIKKVEFSSTIKNQDKMINTYYNNSITNSNQTESFNKLYKDNNNIYEQIGNTKNKKDWFIQEYYNNNKEKEYIDTYDKHNFDQYILDYMPSLINLNNNVLIDNK